MARTTAFWWSVPKGSTLELRLTPGPNHQRQYGGWAKQYLDDAEVLSVGVDQMHPGPARLHLLEKADSYVIRIMVERLGDDPPFTVRAKARIVGPDGEPVADSERSTQVTLEPGGVEQYMYLYPEVI